MITIYTIEKSFNNNALLLRGEGKEQIIILGKGIGFNKRTGDSITVDSAEQTFVLKDSKSFNKYEDSFLNIPFSFLEIMQNVMVIINKEFKTQTFDEKAYVALTDHLFFALKRYKLNFRVILDEFNCIQHLYPKEYEVAAKIIEFMNGKLHIEFPESEVAMTAVHLYSASQDLSLSLVKKKTEVLDWILLFVQLKMPDLSSSKSLAFTRFLKHMEFLLNRISDNSFLEDSALEKSYIETRFNNSFMIADEIIKMIEREYQVYLPVAETVYLCLHLEQLNFTIK